MIKFAMTIALLALSISAQAQFIGCNGCNEAGYQQTAVNQGIGTHYISDTTNRVATGWQNSLQSNGVGGWEYVQTQVPVPTNLQNGFNDWLNLLDHYQQGADIVVVVPTPRPPGYPSQTDGQGALAWASTTQNVAAMRNYLINLQSTIWTNNDVLTWENAGAGSLGMVIDMIAAQSGVSITVLGSKIEPNAVQFEIDSSEGSSISLSYDPATGATTLTAVVDRYGNSLPLNHNAANGVKFKVPTSDTDYTQKLGNYLNKQMGYTLVQGGGGTGTQHGATCVEETDGDGNTTYTCAVF